jgi:hypothetical protein
MLHAMMLATRGCGCVASHCCCLTFDPLSSSLPLPLSELLPS